MDTPAWPIKPPSPAGFFRRKDFPDGFVFGSATSAFQVEGALTRGNRGPSTWDEFSVKNDLYLPYTENAVGHFYRYKDDVSIIKDVGFDAYRFSIAWSRVMPNGREPNEEGIQFYEKILDELHANGIEPFVTIWHFDYPQALEDEYGGFLSSKIVEDFKNYADLCFRRFGTKVKNWITLNEPIQFVLATYLHQTFAPGAPISAITSSSVSARSKERANIARGSTPFSRRFSQLRSRSSLLGEKRSFDAMSVERPSKVVRERNTGKDPYTAGHNLLLSHAIAVKLYKENYQDYQQGQIGITQVTYWYEPYTDLQKDIEATQRAQDFTLGWFMDPLTKGKYPEIMRELITDGRLPEFTDEESEMLKGSFDFIGMNYYTALYVADNPYSTGGDWDMDPRISTSTHRNGIPIGEPSASDWLYIYPRGIMDLLLYMKIKYNNPIMYITENGIMELDDSSLPLWKALYDYKRISFYFEHLWYVRNAIWLGVNMKGYFQWALLDNLEWSNGFSYRFGINYVDYKNGSDDGSQRYPKLSAGWFKFLLEK